MKDLRGHNESLSDLRIIVHGAIKAVELGIDEPARLYADLVSKFAAAKMDEPYLRELLAISVVALIDIGATADLLRDLPHGIIP